MVIDEFETLDGPIIVLCVLCGQLHGFRGGEEKNYYVKWADSQNFEQ